MSRGKYTPEFKAKIVLEILQGERELGAIAAENNLNPNMVRNWKAEFWKMHPTYLRSTERRSGKQRGRRLQQRRNGTRC